jgi:hypothetical protein
MGSQNSFEPEIQVLHWSPENEGWEQISWSAWSAFRNLFEPFVPLPGVSSGVHWFVICIHDDGLPINLIPHKYLIERNGKIGPDNFYGWNREDRADYERLMVARALTAADQKRLREIQFRAGDAMYPPLESVSALKQVLPKPPEHGSLAEEFLKELSVLSEIASGTFKLSKTELD